MSASLIGWIVSILFIVILVAGFFVGFWRGLKRSTVNLLISLVGVVVAFFVTPLITNAILSIQVTMDGEQVALHSLILKFVMSNEEISSLVDKNPNLESFFLNLPQAIINVVLFMIVTILIECLIYIVYKILAVTVFKIKEDEKKRKLLGGVVGCVKSFIIVLFAFMPIASLIGVANTCVNSGDYGITSTAQVMTVEEDTSQKGDNGVLTSYLPDVAVNAIEGLENNLLTKMCGMFGLDDALFDYYGSFDLDGEKIVVREEIVNVYNVVDIASQLSKVDGSYTFKDFNYQKITKQFNKLSTSSMFENILADTLGEIIMNYKEYSFISDTQFAQDNAEILDAISLGLKAYTEAGGKVSDYFTEDITKLVNIATAYGQKGTIDEIVALETIDADGIIKVLTSDDNYETTKTNLQILFSMNLVRDGVEEIAKKAVSELSTEVDQIGVSTDAWLDEDWNELSNSLASIAKRYANIADKVNILEVVKDATILLDEDKNYDIAGILSELGSLIDEARAVNLLQTAENKPIIDKLLSTYNIPIPDEEGVIEEVIENDGTNKTLKSHKDLFEFISPSLVKIRDKKVYSCITSSGTTNEKIISLATIVSEEGNETLLSDIIMPLYQVEPTKTLIVQELKTGLQSDLVNLSNLSGYSEWKNDLNYISAMLKSLNSKQVGNDTFLTLALNNQMDTIIDNLAENEVEGVIKPVLYAKSTSGVENSILSSLQSDLRTLTGDGALTLSSTGVTFVEGEVEDQAQEFCEVIKAIIQIPASTEFKNIDKAVLGNALSKMQSNAYRVELSTIDNPKAENGIFKDTFIALMTKFKSEYSDEITILESDPDTLEEKIGVRSFAQENYKDIDFTALMDLIAELEG